MTDTYTKLFSSIVASTVWGEPHSTRSVWTTMLALSDREGVVNGSLPGLARLANATLAETEAALATFLSPDPYSRTPDNEGRRIELVPGGWRLLNHALYRAKMNEADRREYKRKWDQEKRDRKNPTKSDKSDSVRQIEVSNPTDPTHTDSDSDSDSVEQQDQTHSAPAAPAQGVGGEVPKRIRAPKADAPKTTHRFAEFWAAYPVKRGRADAIKKWAAKGLDAIADQILAHVRRMEREDAQWKRGFIPHGSTYVNAEGWQDEPAPDPEDIRKRTTPSPAPEAMGAKAALKRTETPLATALAHIRHQFSLGAYGDGEAAEAEARRLSEEARARHEGNGESNGNET